MYQTILFWYTLLVLDTLEPESIFSHFITITQESPNLFNQIPEESPNLFDQIPEESPNLYTEIAGIATDTGNLKSETRKALHPSPYQHKHLINKYLQAQ